MSDDDRLFDEHSLRRALRLDADELAPRLDAALIASAARAGRERSRDLIIVAGIAFLGGWLFSEVSRAALAALLALTGVDPLALAIQLAAAGAVRLAPLAAMAADPAIPLAIAAAAMLAFAFEQRRIKAHAPSS